MSVSPAPAPASFDDTVTTTSFVGMDSFALQPQPQPLPLSVTGAVSDQSLWASSQALPAFRGNGSSHGPLSVMAHSSPQMSHSFMSQQTGGSASANANVKPVKAKAAASSAGQGASGGSSPLSLAVKPSSSMVGSEQQQQQQRRRQQQQGSSAALSVETTHVLPPLDLRGGAVQPIGRRTSTAWVTTSSGSSAIASPNQATAFGLPQKPRSQSRTDTSNSDVLHDAAAATAQLVQQQQQQQQQQQWSGGAGAGTAGAIELAPTLKVITAGMGGELPRKNSRDRSPRDSITVQAEASPAKLLRRMMEQKDY
jgi:hypothetical protein